MNKKKEKAVKELQELITDCITANNLYSPSARPVSEVVAEAIINAGYVRLVSAKERLITYNGMTKRISDWAREYNMRYAVLHNRLLAGWSMRKALSKPISRHQGSGYKRPVNKYDPQGNFIKQFPSMTAAAKDVGVCVATIMKCCQGKTLKTKGFVYKYADECVNEEK